MVSGIVTWIIISVIDMQPLFYIRQRRAAMMDGCNCCWFGIDRMSFSLPFLVSTLQMFRGNRARFCRPKHVYHIYNIYPFRIVLSHHILSTKCLDIERLWSVVVVSTRTQALGTIIFRIKKNCLSNFCVCECMPCNSAISL